MDPNTLSAIPNGLAVLYTVYIAAAVWRSRPRAPGYVSRHWDRPRPWTLPPRSWLSRSEGRRLGEGALADASPGTPIGATVHCADSASTPVTVASAEITDF